MKEQAPYVRWKDYDHENVETEFHTSKWMNWGTNVILATGVCCLMLLAMAVALQVPDSWFSWLILAVGSN